MVLARLVEVGDALDGGVVGLGGAAVCEKKEGEREMLVVSEREKIIMILL